MWCAHVCGYMLATEASGLQNRDKVCGTVSTCNCKRLNCQSQACNMLHSCNPRQPTPQLCVCDTVDAVRLAQHPVAVVSQSSMHMPHPTNFLEVLQSDTTFTLRRLLPAALPPLPATCIVLHPQPPRHATPHHAVRPDTLHASPLPAPKPRPPADPSPRHLPWPVRVHPSQCHCLGLLGPSSAC